MEKGWRNIVYIAIAVLVMVLAFSACTTDNDSPENNTEQGGEVGEVTHEWDNGKITKAATENDDGEKTFTCTKCGETKTEIIPALGHKHTIASEWSFDEALHWHEASCKKEAHRADKAAHEWSEGEITKVATENDDGEKTFTCTICGKTKTEAIPALGHEHTISSEWASDEALHWHEASCGKETHRTDKTAHEWNDGEITKATTENDDGEKTFTCAICGKTKTEAIPALGHEHAIASEWASDEAHHWHEASCGKEEHRADKTAHEWNEGEITKAATESDDGEKTFACATCGETRTEAIPVLGHEHIISSEWTYNESLHWHEATCGREEHQTDKTAHEWDTGEMTTEPTCTAEGETTYTCTVCGKTRGESIAAKGHSYGTTWKNNANNHWNECTSCEERGNFAEHATMLVTLTSDGERKEVCPTCGYGDMSSAWTNETLSELSAALDEYVKTNANAKVKVVGKLSDENITEISDVVKQFSKDYDSSKQIDLDLSGTIGLKITEMMFYCCTSLASVTLPNNLTTIGKGAFRFCTSLENIMLSNGLTTIDDSAFARCHSLESVTFPNNLTTIGDQAFYECIRLESVTLPNSLTTGNFGERVFEGCKSLANVTIPDGLTTIGNCAFSGCTSLTSITIPKSVTEIGYSVFYGCEKLEKVEGMEGLTVIGESVFYECKSLKTIRIPSLVTEIGILAFAQSGLEEITLNERLRKIGRCAFFSCKSLQQIEIPVLVYFIGHSAFSRCSSITSIKFKGVYDWKRQKWDDPTVSFAINVSDDKNNVEMLTKDTDALYDLIKD